MKTTQNSKIDLSSILLNASFLLFSTLIIGIVSLIETSPAHAESTSSSAKASVTVSDTIRLTLTGGDLVINNLTPGTSADSNIITATVTSNSPYGFHLSATTGTKNGTTSLVNTADSNFSFTNLNANKATLNDFSDNTWGYSYSTNDGTSWVSGDYGTTQSGYNGLSLDNDDSGATGTTLFNSDSYTNSTAVKFKIGAKSSSTQASGTYTGTVNFYAVANPAPLFYMQDMTTTKLNQLLPNQHDTVVLYDKRDEQGYTIAKLKDDKYWMVENLNLAGGTEIESTKSDVPEGWTLSTTNNFLLGNRLPTSTTAGFNDNAKAFVYNSGNTLANKPNCGKSGQDIGCYSYYSWIAATAGSGLDATKQNTNALYSICPKGWKLPTAYNTDYLNWRTESDFYGLAHEYGLDSTSFTTENDEDFYVLAGPDTIPNFLLSGMISYGSFSTGGAFGRYWSSTAYSREMASYSYFSPSDIVVNVGNSWRDGFSVRCLFSGQ